MLKNEGYEFEADNAKSEETPQWIAAIYKRREKKKIALSQQTQSMRCAILPDDIWQTNIHRYKLFIAKNKLHATIESLKYSHFFATFDMQ